MSSVKHEPHQKVQQILQLNNNNNNNKANHSTPTKQNNKKTNPTSHQKSHDPKTPPSSSSNQNQDNPGSAATSATKKPNSKVSHVICKFFKAGNCSAGTTCQFSHSLPELGHGKPVCQWFVKGNCRFAHKCALAHILPGQPMSMDRKNKRAAQAAAREAAAASASENNINNHVQIDHPFPPSPPPELTLELAEDESKKQKNGLSSKSNVFFQQPSTTQSILDSPSPPELRSRPARNPSSRLLLSDLELESSNQIDDLQFGLPDDFANSDPSLHLSPSGHHQTSRLFPNSFHHQTSHFNSSYPDHHPHQHFISRLSPIFQHNNNSNHNNNRHHHHNPLSSSSSSSSLEHHHPNDRPTAQAWPRDQSPTPFGAGSPFSAPGSRSVFLPRIGSTDSEDGFPRSAPSVTTSPSQIRHSTTHPHPNVNHQSSHNHNDNNIQDDLWNTVQIDREEDVTELLPSSLHSLLTPAERHRQHIRKHAPHTLYSRSVPAEDTIGSQPIKKPTEPSALRNGIVLNPHSLCVSPAPGFNHKQDQLHGSYFQRDSPHSIIRPQPTSHLSSSYIPPTTPFGTWDHDHTHVQNPQQKASTATLSPPISSASQKQLGVIGGAFGHAPGTSLPQGLAAGLSRLHFQPPLPTGLTPCGSPSGNPRDHPLSPPRSPPALVNKYSAGGFSSPFSQRMAGLNLGSTTVNHSSPLSRNVSCSPGPIFSSHGADDDDAPFRLEM